jgi:hypothetical protein
MNQGDPNATFMQKKADPIEVVQGIRSEVPLLPVGHQISR